MVATKNPACKLNFKSYNPNFFQIEFKAIRDPDEYLQYVLKFCDFVRNKNNSRENLIIMRGLISSMEDNCIDAECPLKKYLTNLEKGIDSEYYLLNQKLKIRVWIMLNI